MNTLDQNPTLFDGIMKFIHGNYLLLMSILMVLTFAWALGAENVAAAPKSMTLSLSSWTGKQEPALPAWKQMIKDLDHATHGRVKVKIHYLQALGKAKEHYNLALNGIADMAYLSVGFTPGRFPDTDLISFSQARSAEHLTTGLLELMKQGFLNQEYRHVKLLYAWSGTPNNLLWRKGVTPAKKLEDFKGKKIRVPTTAAAGLIRDLGGTPIAMPMPEVYTSLERGVIDGAFTSMSTLDVFRLSQVCDQISRINSLTFAFSLVMNQNSWHQLPKAAKAVLEKNAMKYGLLAGHGHDQYDQAAINRHHPEIFDFSASDLSKIKTMVAPDLNKYINKYEAAGYHTRKAAEVFSRTLKDRFGTDPFLLSQ